MICFTVQLSQLRHRTKTRIGIYLCRLLDANPTLEMIFIRPSGLIYPNHPHRPTRTGHQALRRGASASSVDCTHSLFCSVNVDNTFIHAHLPRHASYGCQLRLGDGYCTAVVKMATESSVQISDSSHRDSLVLLLFLFLISVDKRTNKNVDSSDNQWRGGLPQRQHQQQQQQQPERDGPGRRRDWSWLKPPSSLGSLRHSPASSASSPTSHPTTTTTAATTSNRSGVQQGVHSGTHPVQLDNHRHSGSCHYPGGIQDGG